MASLVTYGTVVEWGVNEPGLTGVLVDSLNVDVSTKNHVVTDSFGKNVGWIGYDQSASFSISCRPIAGSSAGPGGSTGPVERLGVVGDLISLSATAGSRMAWNQNLSPGLDAATSIIETLSVSYGAESAMTLNASGTVYNFASA